MIEDIFKNPDCEEARLQANRFIKHINKFLEVDPMPLINVIRVLEYLKGEFDE